MPNRFGVLKSINIMQLEKEYLTVKEICNQYEISSRHVRRIINEFTNEYPKELIHKNKQNEWQIHHLMLSKFKPQRKRCNKYYALTIDPPLSLKVEEIHIMMKFVVDQMRDTKLEIHYVIEPKKENQRNHIHSYVLCSNKKKLLECIRLAFSGVSYKQTEIFDLNGWKSYMVNENNNNITTIKN